MAGGVVVGAVTVLVSIVVATMVVVAFVAVFGNLVTDESGDRSTSNRSFRGDDGAGVALLVVDGGATDRGKSGDEGESSEAQRGGFVCHAFGT